MLNILIIEVQGPILQTLVCVLYLSIISYSGFIDQASFATVVSYTRKRFSELLPCPVLVMSDVDPPIRNIIKLFFRLLHF
jgi:hypothetical protein